METMGSPKHIVLESFKNFFHHRETQRKKTSLSVFLCALCGKNPK